MGTKKPLAGHDRNQSTAPALVPGRSSNKPIVTPVDALHLKLLARLDAVASAQFRRQHDLDQGRTVTFLMTGGVRGWLIPPSWPMVVGVLASASMTSNPAVTFAKIT